jgi:hypothetical protein
MTRLFVILGFFFALCNAATEITLKDPKKDMYPPIKFGTSNKPSTAKDIADENYAICPTSIPFICKNDTGIRCLTHDHLNANMEQKVIIKNVSNKNEFGNRELRCKIAQNQINLETNEISLITNATEFSNTPLGENEAQCILIGHMNNIHKNSQDEIIQYFKVAKNYKKKGQTKKDDTKITEAIKIKNKIVTTYFKNPAEGQMNLKFFSCSKTKKGIEDAKTWYDQNKKAWYKQYSVWIFTALVIIGLVLRCVYVCHGEENAAHVNLDNHGSDDQSEFNTSTFDSIIDISELKSLQSLETSMSEQFSITVTPELLHSLTISHEKYHSQFKLQLSSQSSSTKEQEPEEQKSFK